MPSNVRDGSQQQQENPMKRLALITAVFAIAACAKTETPATDTAAPALAPAPVTPNTMDSAAMADSIRMDSTRRADSIKAAGTKAKTP
jgi:hypothetical protein